MCGYGGEVSDGIGTGVCAHVHITCFSLCLSAFPFVAPFADDVSAPLAASALCRGQREMSSVTDAPLTRCATLDPLCNKARSGWNPNNIKSSSSAGVNASHYRTIGFLVQ